MRRQYTVFGLLFLTALSGCVLVPELGKLPQPKNINDYQINDKGSLSSTDWPKSSWWEAYEDTQLNACIGEAFINAPTIVEAEARLRKAAGYAEQAGAKLFPATNLTASYNKLKQSYNYGVPEAFVPKGFQDNVEATLDFNYELDFWGRNRHLVEAATSTQEAAALDIEQARLIVSTAIAEAYAELSKLYADLDTAQEALKVRTKTTQLFKMRFHKGLENEGGYKQALAASELAEEDIQALLESISLTKNRIAALMGEGPGRGQKLERPHIAACCLSGVPNNIPAELLGRRPDIIAARYRVEASASQVQVAQANFYPNINLSALVGYQSLGLEVFTNSGSRIGSFGPAINLPIFNGGNLRGQYYAARADYEAAVAQYNAAVVNALNDVANALTSLNKIGIRIQKTKAAVIASRSAYDVIHARYKGGLATYLEVLRAEDMLIANRRALADILSRSFTLEVALIRALGGGFQKKNDKKEDES